MKRILTTLTLLITLCSFAFGQDDYYFGEPNGPDFNMSVASIIYVDGELQTDQTIEIAAFIDGELRGVCKTSTNHPQAPEPYNGYFYRIFEILGYAADNGKEITFKAYNHETGVELVAQDQYHDFVYTAHAHISLYNPWKLYFETPIEGEAKIGYKGYETLELALADAQADDEITLLQDVTIEQPLNVPFNLTINGGGNTLTYTGRNRAITVEPETNGADLTINDLGVVFTANYCERGINYNTNGILTLNNVKVNVDGAKVAYAVNLPALSDGVTVNIEKSDIKGLIALNIWGENSNITATSSNFYSVDFSDVENYAAIKINNDGVNSADNTSFTTQGGSIIAYDYNGEPSVALSCSVVDVVINIADDTEVIGEMIYPVAVVYYANTDNFYSCLTLKEAYNKAVETNAAGIKLVQSTQGEGIVIDNDITIDFNGKTYTFTSPAVGSNGTQTIGFQIKKDNDVTLKNGTLNVLGSAGEDFAMLIQNYADLTITDMTLDGKNLNRGNYSYVLSNNSGNVIIDGNTSIFANDVEGEKHFAFDSYDYSSADYALPTVTVNTTGTIEGAVEVSATLNLQAVENCLISYIAIEGNGQLFHNGLTTTIVKTVEVASSWETLSAPTEEGKAVFSTTAEKHDFYQYAEDAEMEWDYIGDMVSDNSYTMQAGRGYLYATNAEVSFTGKLNNGTVNYPLSYTATQNLAGFHLIGNPFTHNISFAHLDGKIGEGYYVIGANNEFIAVEPTTSPEEVIAPFQAVLVQATEDADYLAINKEAAVEATREVSNGVLEIVASNGNYSDVAYVSFNEGYGLEKMAHNNANVPMVYLPVGDKNYAIAKYNQDVNEIPVSFVAQTMGEYTIGVKSHDCAFESMYLTDRMTGESVNLLMEDYTFVATSNDNADRFMLTFATTGVEETKEESYIFINNDNMIINNVAGDAIVRIVDMMGRVVSEYNVRESASISTSSLNSGVYVIQMSDDNGVKVQKVVIE